MFDQADFKSSVVIHGVGTGSLTFKMPYHLIFIHSSANEKFNCPRRTLHIANIKAGLEDLAGRVQRG